MACNSLNHSGQFVILTLSLSHSMLVRQYLSIRQELSHLSFIKCLFSLEIVCSVVVQVPDRKIGGAPVFGNIVLFFVLVLAPRFASCAGLDRVLVKS